jgi:hypothetical protein
MTPDTITKEVERLKSGLEPGSGHEALTAAYAAFGLLEEAASALELADAELHDLRLELERTSEAADDLASDFRQMERKLELAEEEIRDWQAMNAAIFEEHWKVRRSLDQRIEAFITMAESAANCWEQLQAERKRQTESDDDDS